MRVDKYLWCIRAFKTRSLATNHCREGKVFVGEKAVKPAQEIRSGEVIRVRKGAVYFEWEVVDFPRSRVAAALVPEYARDITPESQRQNSKKSARHNATSCDRLAAPPNAIAAIGRSTSRINPFTMFEARSIAAAETRSLRHRVLWPHKPARRLHH